MLLLLKHGTHTFMMKELLHNKTIFLILIYSHSCIHPTLCGCHVDHSTGTFNATESEHYFYQSYNLSTSRCKCIFDTRQLINANLQQCCIFQVSGTISERGFTSCFIGSSLIQVKWRQTWLYWIFSNQT